MDTPADLARLPLTSADPLADRLSELRGLFPEAFAEGRFDAEKLRAALGEKGAVSADERERYGLSWAGKSDALKTLRTLTTATLRPAPGESVAFDATGHAIIEGDNLEVLKILQHAYYGKVKLIYIDPPYNTGGDFIYPDDYAEGLGSYLAFTRQVDEEGAKLTTNVDTSGRFHSRWLTMMYPRLFLARNLLREDGVIFVSIDDHEVHNLRLVMDEIFGEENFAAQLVWKNKLNAGALTKGFSNVHEYILCYSRNPVENIVAPLTDEAISQYKGRDSKFATRGGFVTQPLATGSKDARPNLRYPIIWKGKEIWPDKQWLWSKDRVEAAIANDEIVVNETDGKLNVRVKQYLRDENGEVRKMKPVSILLGPFNQEGSKEIDATLGDGVFDFPKPSALVRYLLSLSINADDGREEIILDFFAGSGTTAQAVLELNAEDGGQRKFVLVQLPEPTGRADFPTIAEITKERVRRVIAKMQTELAAKERKDRKEGTEELPLEPSKSLRSLRSFAANPDLGFRVFKLAESNFAIWDPALAATDPEGLAEQWRLSAENVSADASEQALLYELMLKSGLPLHTPAIPHDVAGQRAYALDEGRLLICLSRDLTREALRVMAQLAPQSVLCLDVAFKGNDALKTNAQLEFQSHGIQFRTA